MAEKSFHLRVITPDHLVLDGEYTSVVLPGLDGYFGVLANHAPLLAVIDMGILRAKPKQGEEIEMIVSNGFVQVKNNDVRVVCDMGEKLQEIDMQRAKEAEKRARERLAEAQAKGFDRARAYAALRRSLLRQTFVERRVSRQRHISHST